VFLVYEIFQKVVHGQPLLRVDYLNVILERQLAQAASWPPLYWKCFQILLFRYWKVVQQCDM